MCVYPGSLQGDRCARGVSAVVQVKAAAAGVGDEGGRGMRGTMKGYGHIYLLISKNQLQVFMVMKRGVVCVGVERGSLGGGLFGVEA